MVQVVQTEDLEDGMEAEAEAVVKTVMWVALAEAVFQMLDRELVKSLSPAEAAAREELAAVEIRAPAEGAEADTAETMVAIKGIPFLLMEAKAGHNHFLVTEVLFWEGLI